MTILVWEYLGCIKAWAVSNPLKRFLDYSCLLRYIVRLTCIRSDWHMRSCNSRCTLLSCYRRKSSYYAAAHAGFFTASGNYSG